MISQLFASFTSDVSEVVSKIERKTGSFSVRKCERRKRMTNEDTEIGVLAMGQLVILKLVHDRLNVSLFCNQQNECYESLLATNLIHTTSSLHQLPGMDFINVEFCQLQINVIFFSLKDVYFLTYMQNMWFHQDKAPSHHVFFLQKY